ncbi:RNA polymerase sigma factor RpoE [Labilithrix luteola]|uniref:RNA polymerase sigma factor RpoE n=1 Tax=Labilithrix luteola TaxID=1391654 RepID=A0A0K1Q4L3_9BACT|nr:RNA polymerase sigma factor RpoE [Labilithrix luteola]
MRQIVETNFDFIWRSLRGLGVPASLADDAAQQVFWLASRKLDDIAVGSERSFLFATARGIAANVRRSQVRRQEDFDEDAIGRQVDRSPNPEQAAASNQARRHLERILDGMSEDLRTAFVLFELEGLTTSALAELLGIPMGTVASRLRRAREVFDRETALLQAESGGKP